jgi:hypothetical protein
MSTHVGNVGVVGNNHNVQNGMYVGPYLTQDMPASAMDPRIKPYGGWASYKNVKSGQYNRQLCWSCADFKGFPQAPGVYNLNIVDTPLAMPNRPAMNLADNFYQTYQAERMSNHPGQVGSGYVNYLNEQCGALYPRRYVKGYWPDEQLIYTNTPAPRQGC